MFRRPVDAVGGTEDKTRGDGLMAVSGRSTTPCDAGSQCSAASMAVVDLGASDWPTIAAAWARRTLTDDERRQFGLEP
jgi:hypothetical protein